MGAPMGSGNYLLKKPLNKIQVVKMLLVEKFLRLYERVKADNKPCEVETIEAIEGLVSPGLINRLIDAEKHEYQLAGYQWRARSIRTKNEDSIWGNWSLCNESTFLEYKNRPFVGGWQFEARKVFAKELVSQTD